MAQSMFAFNLLSTAKLRVNVPTANRRRGRCRLAEESIKTTNLYPEAGRVPYAP
jgi:hypothetical protein